MAQWMQKMQETPFQQLAFAAPASLVNIVSCHACLPPIGKLSIRFWPTSELFAPPSSLKSADATQHNQNTDDARLFRLPEPVQIHLEICITRILSEPGPCTTKTPTVYPACPPRLPT